MKKLGLILLVLLLSGCGPFMAGTWEDDPKNWKRAFGEAPPADLIVHHSYYCRSPQPILLEFTYFFEVEDSKPAREYLGFHSVLKPTSRKIAEVDFISLPDDRAPWFPAGASGDYEVWLPGDKSYYVVIVDRKRGRLFLTDRM